MERGILSAGRDAATGDHRYPKLELVRVTIPRRVYTQAHLDYVADTITQIASQKGQLRGLKITYQPEFLRHFTAHFEPL